MSEDVQYVQRVSRFRSVGQKYWFDLLIALLAISAMLEVVVGRDSPGRRARRRGSAYRRS